MNKRNKLILSIAAILLGIVLKYTSRHINPPVSFVTEIIGIVLLMGGIVFWMIITFKELLLKK